jgi:opacity protein-like surface antigen
MRLMKATIVALLFVMVCTATAQDYPRAEIALGYSLVRVSSTGFVEQFTQQGASTNIALNFSRHVGIVADFGGYNNNNIRNLSIDNTLFTYTFGPRFSYRTDRITLFGDALFGGGHISGSFRFANTPAGNLTAEESNNSFAMVIGGGLDINAGKHFAVRPAQVDYLLTRFNPLNESPTQNNLRYSAMIVFKF